MRRRADRRQAWQAFAAPGFRCRGQSKGIFVRLVRLRAPGG